MDAANSVLPVGEGDERLDGRTQRRIDNRRRILDATWDLVAEGERPTAATIAERAGVSVRSLYNHFASARELVAGLYERGDERVQHLRAQLPSADVPFDERARRWAEVCAQILEEIADVRWRSYLAEERYPNLQPENAGLRRRYREEVARAFPELGPRGRAAVVTLTSSLGWRSLRRDQGLSVAEASRVVEETIKGVVS